MITDVNPFIYSRPLAPEDVMDRDVETAKLLELAVGGHYVRLYAPRKFGKTSLLGRVLRDGESSEGLIPIMVDLYGVLSIADIAVRIERAYAKHLKGAIRKAADKALKSTGLGLSLGAYGLSAKLQLDPKIDPLPALHALLDLPLRLEAGGGYRALIVFDEFQDIGKVADMDAFLRAHIQYQGEVASYVFAGSESGMMEQLFEDKDRPLYGSAVPMRLERLKDEDIANYVATRFAETDRDVGEGLNPLLASAKGHPQRSVQLAHRLWEKVPRGEAASFETWEEAHQATLEELDQEFDGHWRSLETSQQRALRSIVAGRGSPLRRDVLTQLDAEKTTTHHALQRLLASSDVERQDNKYVIVDPLFTEWIDELRSLS